MYVRNTISCKFTIQIQYTRYNIIHIQYNTDTNIRTNTIQLKGMRTVLLIFGYLFLKYDKINEKMFFNSPIKSFSCLFYQKNITFCHLRDF